MDPVQEELQRYIDIRDRLLLDTQEKEEGLLSFYGDVRVFEQSFIQKINPLQQRLNRWKHRSSIMDELLKRLESEVSLPLTSLEWRKEVEQKLKTPVDVAPPKPIPILSKEEKSEAKKLYRDLARRFHPDLIQDEKKREERRSLMASINQAYQENNLDVLREQQHLPDIPEGREEKQGDVWTRLVREIALLRKKITAQEAEMRTARESELGVLLAQSETEELRYFENAKAILLSKIRAEQQRWRQLRIQEERYWMEKDV